LKLLLKFLEHVTGTCYFWETCSWN